MKQALCIIATALLICFAYYLGTKQCKPAQPYEVIRIDTVPGDSVPYAVYYPVPVPDTILFTDTLPVYIDTNKIISEYFASVYYTDTLMDDTSALIVLYEKISRNRIEDRSLLFQNRKKTYINIYEPIKKPQKYHAITAKTILNNNTIGFGLGYKYRNMSIGLVKMNSNYYLELGYTAALF